MPPRSRKPPALRIVPDTDGAVGEFPDRLRRAQLAVFYFSRSSASVQEQGASCRSTSPWPLVRRVLDLVEKGALFDDAET